jgi:hypothetical protein
VLRGVAAPFQPTAGLALLTGDLGSAVIKTSAIAQERHIVEAPARVFHSQEALQAAFKACELTEDVVAVVRFQGPRANGMPELHKLMPPLGVLQDRGLGSRLGRYRRHHLFNLLKLGDWGRRPPRKGVAIRSGRERALQSLCFKGFGGSAIAILPFASVARRGPHVHAPIDI